MHQNIDADCIFRSDFRFNFCLFSQARSVFSKWFTGVPGAASQTTVLWDSNSTKGSTCRVPQHLQLPQVSITDSAFLTSGGAVTEHREAAFWLLKLLCCPWGYHDAGSCCLVHGSLCKAPEVGWLLGKEGGQGCKDIQSFFTLLSQQFLGSEQVFAAFECSFRPQKSSR